MAFQLEDGQGTLFTNTRKEGKQPDMRGEAMWKGERVELAGWKRKDKNGNVWLSLRLQEPRQRTEERDGDSW